MGPPRRDEAVADCGGRVAQLAPTAVWLEHELKFWYSRPEHVLLLRRACADEVRYILLQAVGVRPDAEGVDLAA